MSFELRHGSAPLLVSIPHVGTSIPGDLHDDYVPRALDVEDADWHLDRLYAFAQDLGASILRPQLARYVIDLNRPPDDAPMYPGASNTELCPTRFFTGEPLHLPGRAPDAQERERRLQAHWMPYHGALQAELSRILAEHGWVLLWDAHSIRSCIPWLFEGVLPDLNIGTAGGSSAHPSVTDAVAAAAARTPADITLAVNGRFQGGYITRRYGRPLQNVHAVQLELAQKQYMREEPPYDWIDERAQRLQPVLRDMVTSALRACEALHA